MGCSSCGGARATPINGSPKMMVVKSVELEDCEYTNEMLIDFKKRLEWFKNKAIYVRHGYKASTINKYIGLVGTSINIYNKCTYKQELETISDLVSFIITLQDEQ